MADIASTDVVYTLQEGTQSACPSDPRYSAVFKIAFGDSALTYPSGGIPLLKGKLGCPAKLLSLELIDMSDGDGYSYKFNYEGSTIKIYQSPARTHTHDFKVIGSQAAASTDAISAKTLTLGKEAVTDITIAGANSATLGGVVSATLAAAVGTEVTAASFAPAATVLYARVVGY